MRFSIRDLVYIGIFAALWGAIELSLGSALHALNAPFNGAVLSSMGIGIALVGRLFVPKRGSILVIGVLAAILKPLGTGGILWPQIAGILIESLIAECVVDAWGRYQPVSFTLAGGLATLWTLFQPHFTFGLIGGQSLAEVHSRTLAKGAAILGLGSAAGWLVLVLLVTLHETLGGAAGLLAWMVGRNVRLRPRRRLTFG